MKRIDSGDNWQWLWSKQAWLYLWIPVLLISIAHYSTGAGHHWVHDIFRRMYYIPIVLGAFAFGLRGALAASVFASLIYSPHAFTQMFEHDPAHTLEKVLEILLYNVVALITGALADQQYRMAKRLEEALEDKEVMAQQLIRSGRLQALGELTAGLAHEIKNPLASLKGSAEIIADEIPDPSPRRRMVDIHMKELDRLNDLLERFLSFARPRAFEIKSINICDIVNKTITLVSSQAGQRQIQIEWSQPDSEMIIHGDGEKISQVIINLILNAIQASPDNGRIEVACSRESQGRRKFACLEIKDNGAGIPLDQQEKIFNPFFTTKESGTGLGLSIASRIVDEHDGFIKVENPAEGGASFKVFLQAD